MGFRSLHRNVKVRIAVGFAFGIAQNTTFPFMAIYFAHSFGETLTGMLLAVAVALSVLSGAVGGYYADRIGRRKVMMAAELVFFFAYTAMAVANLPRLNSPIVTMAAFMVTNICWGVYGPADDAMLLDVTTPETRQLVYSIFYWTINLTMAIGTAIGALLFESHRALLFSVMAAVVLGTWLTTVFLIQETYHPARPAQAVHPLRGMFRNYRVVLTDRVFVRYVLAGLLSMYGEFQLRNYIGIHFAKTVPNQPLLRFHHFTLWVDGVKLLGWVQTENTLLVVLLAVTAIRFIQGRSERRVLFVGLGLQTLAYGVITAVSRPVVALVAMLFGTVGEVVCAPIRQAYLGDLAPEHARSAYAAVNGMTFQGTQLLASLGVALGAVVPAWGMAAVSVAFGFVGIALYQTIAAHKQTLQRAGKVDSIEQGML